MTFVWVGLEIGSNQGIEEKPRTALQAQRIWEFESEIAGTPGHGKPLPLPPAVPNVTYPFLRRGFRVVRTFGFLATSFGGTKTFQTSSP